MYNVCIYNTNPITTTTKIITGKTTPFPPNNTPPRPPGNQALWSCTRVHASTPSGRCGAVRLSIYLSIYRSLYHLLAVVPPPPLGVGGTAGGSCCYIHSPVRQTWDRRGRQVQAGWVTAVLGIRAGRDRRAPEDECVTQVGGWWHVILLWLRGRG